MLYTDLNALLDGSSSTRGYFLSLPVDMHGALIHTAQDLHRMVLLKARQGNFSLPKQ